MLYHVMSCHVMSCHVISYHVMISFSFFSFSETSRMFRALCENCIFPIFCDNGPLTTRNALPPHWQGTNMTDWSRLTRKLTEIFQEFAKLGGNIRHEEDLQEKVFRCFALLVQMHIMWEW